MLLVSVFARILIDADHPKISAHMLFSQCLLAPYGAPIFMIGK